MYAFDKIQCNLVGMKAIVFINHASLRYLLSKKDAKLRSSYILLLQEFDIEIRDRKG